MGSSGGTSLGMSRNFLLLWVGHAFSSFGSSVAAIAYPIVTLAVTESATLAGLVGFVGLGAGTIFRLPAGVLIDRVPLRRLLVVADLVRAVAAGMVCVALIADRLTFIQLLLTALVTGICGVFSDAAQSVAVRHVVPPDQLPQAFALNEGRGHAVGLVGQPAGGLLYSVQRFLPFLTHALSYLLSALLIRSIKDPMTGTPPADGHAKIRSELFIGLRYFWGDAFLRASMICAAGFQFIFSGLALALIAGLTARGTPTSELGLIFALGAAGGIAGAVIAPLIQKRLSPVLLVTGFGWTATLSLLALAGVDSTIPAGLLIGLIYLTATPANAMFVAVQIHITPKELQGKVLSAMLLVAGIFTPLGPLGAGLLIDFIGYSGTFLAFAALSALLTVAMHVMRPIRTMVHPT
ncbi:MFS transporter [Arthrobacter tumbae]